MIKSKQMKRSTKIRKYNISRLLQALLLETDCKYFIYGPRFEQLRNEIDEGIVNIRQSLRNRKISIINAENYFAEFPED